MKIWTGHRCFNDEAELKSEVVHCGHCGSKMREALHPSPTFDRKTGKQDRVGALYWECPKRGIGMDAMHGDWSDEGYEANPHDSTVLRVINA